MSLIYKFILIVSISCYSYALDKIYFLPQDARIAKKDILKLINNANSTIDIAMYNFDLKKFAKALKKSSKKGIDITLIYEKSKLKFHKKIKLIKTRRKQHIKLAIIDSKYAIYGSANWKKESFGKNYEIINITDDEQRINRFINIIKTIKKENR